MHFIRLISCIGAFLGLAMSGATAVAQVSLVPQAAARCTSSECSRFDAIVFERTMQRIAVHQICFNELCPPIDGAAMTLDQIVVDQHLVAIVQ